MADPTPAHNENAAPAGESRVWLCSMALALGILMVFGMLGLIFWNGISVFWPKEIVEITLREDHEYRFQGGKTVAGAIAKKGERKEHGELIQEWQLFTGNKDAYGGMFHYMDADAVQSLEQPVDIILAERLEWGNAIFYADSLQYPDGKVAKAAEPGFMQLLEQEVTTTRKRWKTIRKIEQRKIGRINHALKELGIKRNKLEEAGADTDELDNRIREKQEAYNELAAKTREMRRMQEDILLHVTLPDGAKKTMPVGNILRFIQPNRMGFAEKASHFASHLWLFVSEQPRESNTEGGIFPAIFGTFVMTLLMSAAVMPTGVLAAIYLHEYAHQGPMLRTVRIAINNLAGVPSIVFGVFGLGFFVYGVGSTIDEFFFHDQPSAVFGTGGVLWASLTLAIMTVPVVIVATEEALASVTRGMREASLACGASKWQTIQRVVLPASAPGILTGLILAMARGAGEVAPLMLVGAVKLAPDLPIDATSPFVHFERKFMHLGFHIYDLGFQSPDSEAARPMVFATTFLLILLVLVLNLGAILIRNHLRRKYASVAF